MGDSLFKSDNSKNENSGHKSPEKCYEIHRYAPHMFSLVCKNILRSNYNNKGLLHSLKNLKISEDDSTSEIDNAEIDILLAKCVENSDLSVRESAAMELIEILAADEDNEEEEDEGLPDDNDDHESDSIGGESNNSENER